MAMSSSSVMHARPVAGPDGLFHRMRSFCSVMAGQDCTDSSTQTPIGGCGLAATPARACTYNRPRRIQQQLLRAGGVVCCVAPWRDFACLRSTGA